MGSVVQQKTFPVLLREHADQVAAALPKHLTPERMCRIAMTAFNSNQALRDCDPMSIFASVIVLSQMGLEVGINGHAYLIPYKGKCTPVPGWRGLVDLVSRTGRATVYTGLIYKDQKYEFIDGSERRLTVFNETELEEDSDATHAYAVGWIKGATIPVIELWTAQRIRKHRDRYNKVGPKHYSFQQWAAYMRKVVLLQVLKYMPSSAELTVAIEVDRVSKPISFESAVQGIYLPSPEDVDVTVDATQPATETPQQKAARVRAEAKEKTKDEDGKYERSKAAIEASYGQTKPEKAEQSPKTRSMQTEAQRLSDMRGLSDTEIVAELRSRYGIDLISELDYDQATDYAKFMKADIDMRNAREMN